MPRERSWAVSLSSSDCNLWRVVVWRSQAITENCTEISGRKQTKSQIIGRPHADIDCMIELSTAKVTLYWALLVLRYYHWTTSTSALHSPVVEALLAISALSSVLKWALDIKTSDSVPGQKDSLLSCQFLQKYKVRSTMKKVCIPLLSNIGWRHTQLWKYEFSLFLTTCTRIKWQVGIPGAFDLHLFWLCACPEKIGSNITSSIRKN